MGRVRAVLAGLGRDELSGAARTTLGLIVVFVPFGSLVLLTRWSPVRRLLRKCAPKEPEASETPAAR
jgi:hypothetical protein